GQRVGAAVGGLRGAAVLVARERGGRSVREKRLQSRRADRREQPLVREAMLGGAVAEARRDSDEVAAGGAEGVVRLGAGSDFDAAGVFHARADVAADSERG